MKHHSLARRAIRPETALALGFLAVILLGGLLLLLPACSADGRSMGVLAALFTSASSVCVTGLSVIEPGTQLSLAGQAVQLLLIQLGGLGFMTFATLIMTVIGRKMSLKSRLLLRESMNQPTLGGMVRLSLRFLLAAVIIEACGAVLLMARFIPLYDGAKGVWYSVFTSVSAFCNAGIELFGQGGIGHLAGESYVLFTLCALTLLGGLGFPVIMEGLQNRFRWRSWSLHAKIVLCANAALLLFGTLTTLLLERTNPRTLGGMGCPDRLVNSFFHAVMLRSSGFAVLDQAALTNACKLLSIPQMFIGAASASTGGGVKVTTAAVLLLATAAVIKGRERVILFGREIDPSTIRRALAVTLIALTAVLASACLISIIETRSGFDMLDVLYEATAALSTTGLSSLGTQNLSSASLWLLIPLMYLGRLGPLTLALALASRMERVPEAKVHFPEEKIMIG